MSSFVTQLKVLLYKNVLIKKRRKKLTMLEVLFPLYFVMALVVMQMTHANLITRHSDAVPSYPVVPIYPLKTISSPIVLAYSPNSDAVSNIMNVTASREHIPANKVHGFSTLNDLTSYYKNNEDSIWGGINVDAINSTSVQYEISVNSSMFSSDIGNANLIYYGYLALQTSFLESWMSVMGYPVNLNLTTTQFPTAASTFTLNLFSYLFPLYFPLTFMYSLQQLVVMVVTEKERKLREAFKIMGMKPAASYLSWFLVHTAINIVTVVFIVVILFGVGVFKHSNFIVVLLPFILYGFTVTLLGFLVSIFTEKPRVATAVSSLTTLLTVGVYYLIHFFVYQKGHNSFGLQLLFSLVSGIGFSEFSFQLAVAESNGIGIQFSDAAFGHVCLFLCIDIVLYLFLIWYLDNIYVGNYGVAKKFYFPFTKKYWQKETSTIDPNINVNTPLLAYSQNGGGIQVTNLYKEYDGDVKAVNGLTINVTQGQILALLGHNGAGKSTTINILTGLFPPTSGTINIMGYDYENQLDIIRRMIGYCPQHNILLDQLTCAEHLRIFGKLKGVSEHQIEAEIIDKLEEVGLLDKKDTMSSELSGGMKRKLSVAIAFIGGSSIIFLDECTAGMDPYSRRKIWQLLQKYKSRKTIIMTTHFMEEAELLGDFIAIMAKGKLRCSGTSLQLKHQFGVGYILRIVKENERASYEKLDSFVKSTFPESTVLASPSGLELIYSIPNDMTNFSTFFNLLQTNQQSLNVKSYGLSMTTLEEVFLKTNEFANEENEQNTN